MSLRIVAAASLFAAATAVLAPAVAAAHTPATPNQAPIMPTPTNPRPIDLPHVIHKLPPQVNMPTPVLPQGKTAADCLPGQDFVAAHWEYDLAGHKHWIPGQCILLK